MLQLRGGAAETRLVTGAVPDRPRPHSAVRSGLSSTVSPMALALCASRAASPARRIAARHRARNRKKRPWLASCRIASSVVGEGRPRIGRAPRAACAVVVRVGLRHVRFDRDGVVGHGARDDSGSLPRDRRQRLAARRTSCWGRRVVMSIFARASTPAGTGQMVPFRAPESALQCPAMPNGDGARGGEKPRPDLLSHCATIAS